jgi:amidase
MGSPLYAGHVPTYDATSVARLRRAGAIIMGKTVTTEFASLQPPQTHNPWSMEHTPGGSSSGSAVAVAARMCPIALGSQTGGSVVRPAAFNGIVGLKPTHGLISAFGVFPVSWSLDTMGVMARSVEDIALTLQELAGYDKYDSESVDASVPDYRRAIHSLDRAPRIGLLRRFFFEHSLPETRQHVESVCEKLARAGATVEEATLPADFQAALDAQTVLQGVESAIAHRDTYPKYKEKYGHKVVEQLEGGLRASGVAYAQAKQLQTRFASEVHAALAPFGFAQGRAESRPFDVLLTPAYAGAAPHDLTVTGDPLFQRAWTYAGVPSLALPSGVDSARMPLAVQLIARKLDEGRLLAVAAWCERSLSVRLAPSIAVS